LDHIKEVTVYTDGGCIDNPGPGGFGAVLIYGKHRKELSGGYRLTTNNRMELLAVIRALEALKIRCRVTVYSDSQYVVNGLEKGWAARWRANDWWRNKEERAQNPDLWDRLLRLYEFHEVRFKWVRGHAGNTENERCDELARAAARGPNLAVDSVYEGNPGLC
jgi:ribonuclease HI